MDGERDILNDRQTSERYIEKQKGRETETDRWIEI